MDVGSNISAVVPGLSTASPGVGEQCGTTYLCTEQSYFLGADLLQFAPCPPPWKKDLLWELEVARRKGLSEDDTERIALRCVIPQPQTEGQSPTQCGSSCIAIVVLSVCLLLTIFLATLCWFRRRALVRKGPRSTEQNNSDHTQAPGGKTDPAFEEFQEGRIHYSNIMESAYDNYAYTNDLVTDQVTDHARSNSDASNNSHTQLNDAATNQNTGDIRL